MSREALAAATHVGVRTIQRIEKGEVTDSPNAVILEDYLGIGRGDEAPPRLVPKRADEPNGPSLRTASVMEILAELASRFARLERAAGRPPAGANSAEWRTEDAPSARREQDPQHGRGGAL